MIWIAVGAIGLGLFIAGLVLFFKRTTKGKRLDGAGMAEGIGIGMILAAVICIPLSELAGYREALDFASFGLVGGLGLGLYFERRKRRKHLHNQ